jgi:hypothetical protein
MVMSVRRCFVSVAIVLSGCVAAVVPPFPAPDVHLIQVAPRLTDAIYFPGPIFLRYQLIIHNRSQVRFVLRSVALRTPGPAAYRLRTETLSMRTIIPPGQTVTLSLAAWGRWRGDSLPEPVTIRGVADFDTPSGPMRHVFFERISE